MRRFAFVSLTSLWPTLAPGLLSVVALSALCATPARAQGDGPGGRLEVYEGRAGFPPWSSSDPHIVLPNHGVCELYALHPSARRWLLDLFGEGEQLPIRVRAELERHPGMDGRLDYLWVSEVLDPLPRGPIFVVPEPDRPGYVRYAGRTLRATGLVHELPDGGARVRAYHWQTVDTERGEYLKIVGIQAEKTTLSGEREPVWIVGRGPTISLPGMTWLLKLPGSYVVEDARGDRHEFGYGERWLRLRVLPTSRPSTRPAPERAARANPHPDPAPPPRGRGAIDVLERLGGR